jgi:hypothetical protein
VHWFFTAIGSVPVQRGAHRAARASLDSALEVLAAGDGAPLHFGAEYGEAGSASDRRRVTDEIVQAIGALSGQEHAPGYNDPSRV